MIKRPYILARDEVELINPRTTPETFELLRAYHAAEWIDDRGAWHVVITREALEVIEAVARMPAISATTPPGGGVDQRAAGER